MTVAAGAPAQPWCVVNERDELGDDVPFEYATQVQEGAFYGWPWYYIGAHEDPRHEGERPDLAGKVTVPDVLLQAHSAPLSIAFYDGEPTFRADYQRRRLRHAARLLEPRHRTGYKVVRLLSRTASRPANTRISSPASSPPTSGLGPAGRRRGRQGWCAYRHRGRQRNNLAYQPYRTLIGSSLRLPPRIM